MKPLSPCRSGPIQVNLHGTKVSCSILLSSRRLERFEDFSRLLFSRSRRKFERGTGCKKSKTLMELLINQ